MAKKQYFAIVDVETTINNTVADFAMVVCDRNGVIVDQFAVLVKDNFDTMDLFYIASNREGDMWSKKYAADKKEKYINMLNSGTRSMSSVAAINIYIARIIGQYNPIMTAYNISFDEGKCANTNIDLTGFADRFCLWAAAVGNICKSKGFRQFALDNHRFNKPTDKGNMTFQTNAEVVSGYLAGSMSHEPHTALEDIVYFELPILKTIINKRGWKEKLKSYSWNDFQVRDWFVAK